MVFFSGVSSKHRPSQQLVSPLCLCGEAAILAEAGLCFLMSKSPARRTGSSDITRYHSKSAESSIVRGSSGFDDLTLKIYSYKAIEQECLGTPTY